MPFPIHTTRMLCLSKICLVDTMFFYHLVDPDLGGLRCSSKKNGKQKMGELTLSYGIEVPLEISIGS